MFAIYNIEGRRFHDTLENLRKVKKTQASHGMQLLSDVVEDETKINPDDAKKNENAVTISNSALQAYRRVRKLNERERIYHAYQLMTHPVSTVRMDMGIHDAKRYLQEQNVNQMPVVDAQQRTVGMLSVEHLLQFILVDGDQIRYLRDKTVGDAMSKEVITADPISDIRRIAKVMQEYRLQAVPIVDDSDALIGIVSRTDILGAVTNDPPLNMWS